MDEFDYNEYRDEEVVSSPYIDDVTFDRIISWYWETYPILAESKSTEEETDDDG